MKIPKCEWDEFRKDMQPYIDKAFRKEISMEEFQEVYNRRYQELANTYNTTIDFRTHNKDTIYTSDIENLKEVISSIDSEEVILSKDLLIRLLDYAQELHGEIVERSERE